MIPEPVQEGSTRPKAAFLVLPPLALTLAAYKQLEASYKVVEVTESYMKEPVSWAKWAQTVISQRSRKKVLIVLASFDHL